MHVTPLATADLPELRDDWNELAGDAPFRLWEWNVAWWRHYGRLGRLFALCVRDDLGKTLGVAPWFIQTHPARGRVVRFLASGDVCSDYQTILCRQEHIGQVADALAGWLSEHRDHWDLMDFSGIEAEDSPMLRLLESLEQAGFTVERTAALSCWRLELPEKWEDFLARLSKTRRKRTRGVIRQMFDSGRAEFHTVRQAKEFPAAFDTLIDLHQRRWEIQGEPGAFACPRFTAFHRQVAAQFLRQGRLRLHILTLDGRPAAAEYHFCGGGVIYAYQSGVEVDLLEQEPGTLSNIATLRAAHRDGFSAVDFLRGDEPYKANLRAQPRPCHDIRVVPPRLAARLRHTAWKTTRQVKRWIAGAGKAE